MKSLKISKKITDRNGLSINLYLKEVSKIKMLTEEEEFDVAMKAKLGDVKSQERLVEANLRFVISVAKQYQHKNIPLIDLIISGNQGLWESVKTFEPELGNKFISYAVWKIRSRIIENLNKYSDFIYLPTNKKNSIKKVKKAINRLTHELEREPTSYEIYDELSDVFSEDELNNLLKYNKLGVKSYDDELSEDLKIMDFISNGEKTESILELQDIEKKVKAVLDTLNPRDWDIITKFYGIGKESEDLNDIASFWGISNRTASQVRDKALRKMRIKIKQYGLENFYKNLV